MRIHLGGSSRQSLVVARAALDAAVKGVNSASASELSTHLFFASDIFANNTSLRRAITDPSRDKAAKAALVKDLFGKSTGTLAISLLSDVSALRWSGAKDLVYAIEQLAIEAEASAANISNELDRVEDELFQTSRLVADSFELRKALVSSGSAAAKAKLIEDVLGKKASSSTVKLASSLVAHLRGRSIESAFTDYLFGLANRRNRLIAVVRTAAALTDEQRSRLAAALEKKIGQPIRINVQIDPTILGGISIKFADELVDGSVVNRLAGAGRALIGQTA
ncbi:MAG: F0F1 ATP synthase subunit delta [Candidatus Planktophila sp.]|jgi:F-type H+-transporting ATPase subunit delta|tara:strand:+ start:5364 stop:6200 length:837 start_codon:yes stop_codon:yes gene_type:complete